jgi:hypothetical protein
VDGRATVVISLRERLGDEGAALPARVGARDDSRDDRIPQGKRRAKFSDVVGKCGDDVGKLSESRGESSEYRGESSEYRGESSEYRGELEDYAGEPGDVLG